MDQHLQEPRCPEGGDPAPPAIASRSCAYIDTCGELADTALNLKDMEARLPLYATVLCGLLSAGGVSAGRVPAPAASSSSAADVMLPHLLSEEKEARRGAVGQLLARVELLGKEQEEAERRARVAVEEASDEASGALSGVACFPGLADPAWLLALFSDQGV
ncbi:hypothetical protein LY78DRAFT_685986 [Colletotrichum sublineola]|nr:hypothetical protein LY78DRAFT_685986 [Colletotrichum sublineola]